MAIGMVVKLVLWCVPSDLEAAESWASLTNMNITL
jgi:hypothetical protein